MLSGDVVGGERTSLFPIHQAHRKGRRARTARALTLVILKWHVLKASVTGPCVCNVRGRVGSAVRSVSLWNFISGRAEELCVVSVGVRREEVQL